MHARPNGNASLSDRTRIEALPALRDNYIYVLWDAATRKASVIDPGEAQPVIAFLRAHELQLESILCTHHHNDHIGGVAALCEAAGSPLRVVGSADDLARGRIRLQTEAAQPGATLQVLGRPYDVLEVPGHTLGAVAYLGEGRLFSGDTLFLAGCGRMFEGHPEQMHRSLMQLAALAPSTEVYAGHEYTEANLKFAIEVEPNNAAIAERALKTSQLRARGLTTMPGTLAEENATNPFLRCSAPGPMQYAAMRDASAQTPADVFRVLRACKDAF